MRRLILVPFLLLGCEAEGLDPATDLGTARAPIVNGTPVAAGADPAVVLMSVGCTGTLITPKVVLTAAHCVVGENGQTLPPTGMSVIFSNNTQGPSIPVTALVAGNMDAGQDVALLALAQPSTVRPIPFNTKDLAPYVNQPIRIVGFGATSETDQGPPLKRQGTSTLLGVGPLGQQIKAGEMYAAPTPQGTCYGDSGGPAFMVIDGQEVVIGMTSRGAQANGIGQIPPCGQGVDVAARADSHRAMIEAFITQHDPQAAGGGGTGTGGGTGPGTGGGTGTGTGGETGIDPGTGTGNVDTDGDGEPDPMNLQGGCAATPGAASPGAAVVFLLLVLATSSAATGSRRTSRARPASPRRRS